ncbi:MAG: 4Fe-4S dicluster domain-containing protein [Actinomycetes bacterium]
MKLVFVNPEKCIGCLQCEFACAVEHSTSKTGSKAWLEEPTPRTRVHVEPGPLLGTAYPSRCRHCDPAPCQQVCPTSAITRDTEQNLVLVNPQTCINCAMCAMVCPFDALTFHPMIVGTGERTVALKCDGCVERVRRGETPACVEACKVGALVYGELNDLVAEGRLTETGTVLAAVTAVQAAEDAAGDGPVASWRAWGAEVAQVEVAATTVEGGSR